MIMGFPRLGTEGLIVFQLGGSVRCGVLSTVLMDCGMPDKNL